MHKINRKLKFSGKSISSEYINSYTLDCKSKNAIFRDICMVNRIEPTVDICKAFLGCDSPTLRKEWHECVDGSCYQTTHDVSIKSENNISDNQMRPNTVYISSLLKKKFPTAAKELISVLDKHNIIVKELTNTKDIWCRDYMPIQNRLGELVQFKYNPSYLKGKKEWEESRSDVHIVCETNGIKPIYSDINIDGGNIVLYNDKAILTDRIFSENPNYDKDKLIAELEFLLKAKIIVIPAIKTDITGHADGMVRFVNENTILGNNLDIEYKYIRDGINKVCKENGLSYINVPFFEPKKDKSHEMNVIGIYVNYLEVGNLIVLPKFGEKDNLDLETEQLFKKIFPDRIIETVNYNEVALEGGLLNCSTWTIRE